MFRTFCVYGFAFLLISFLAISPTACTNPNPTGPLATYNLTATPTPAPNYLSEWGTYGSGNGEFINPAGIAVNSAGTSLFLVDDGNVRIDVFTGTGVYLNQFGGNGTGPGQFNGYEPDTFQCIALNASGTTIYAADNYN